MAYVNTFARGYQQHRLLAAPPTTIRPVQLGHRFNFGSWGPFFSPHSIPTPSDPMPPVHPLSFRHPPSIVMLKQQGGGAVTAGGEECAARPNTRDYAMWLRDVAMSVQGAMLCSAKIEEGRTQALSQAYLRV